MDCFVTKTKTEPCYFSRNIDVYPTDYHERCKREQERVMQKFLHQEPDPVLPHRRQNIHPLSSFSFLVPSRFLILQK